MNKIPEIEKLVALLSNEPPETKISFHEESARDTRYTLVVGANDNTLLRKLAGFFGCPNQHLPGARDTKFEASDAWHGRGQVDLRALADELMAKYGEFFDFDATLTELRSYAHFA